jgi:alkanesulfonate monooxygenase SsuD/methylene tetrahydromethanopterin reductase-like flavin-dependent oxidoreductase (luciferase family)
MPPIQFGFILPQLPPDPTQQRTFVADLNRALQLVSGHFDSVRMIDHLGNNEGDLESFTTLAYLAALHPRLKFGHTVICQSFRNPALVAMMGATFQLLSGGRFLLGIGAGWDAAEHRAFGYDFPPAGVRVAQLEEALQIIKRMWTEEKVTFVGQHYRVQDAACQPRPDPRPPIMVGAFGPKMLRLTAQVADEWNVSSTGIGRYRRLVESFEHACAAVGRDPASVRRSVGGGCICRPTQAEADRLAGTRYDRDEEGDFDFVGTPQQLIEQMQPFIALGVTDFYLDCGGFPNLTTLELLVSEVLPGVNR